MECEMCGGKKSHEYYCGEPLCQECNGKGYLQEKEAIKPCPFCGRTSENNKYFGGENLRIIHKPDCQITRMLTHDIQYISLNHEIETWNTRAGETE